jgi:hypothetical protein
VAVTYKRRSVGGLMERLWLEIGIVTLLPPSSGSKKSYKSLSSWTAATWKM